MELNSKIDFRQYVLKERDELPIATKEELDDKIFNQLVSSQFFTRAKAIFIFVSFQSEVDTHRVIQHALVNGKIICVPKIRSKAMGIEIYQIDGLDQLKTGYYGVLEPIDGCPAVDKNDIDLILVPGLAFDRQGGRIGYGAGFYDRFFMTLEHHVDKIAMGYSFQLFPKVPTDSWDVKINGIITDQEMLMLKE